ncbi:Serine/threonine-protein kinase StkP [Clostridiales bacterium CHKCI006]|uniref:non-specific serine/threonine protein kinase n=1 Tax=Candidatus Fimiplasma intestinipullorum TaxID=2840825 RepID=A0A9D1HMU8_9FIRM|nr:Serine/threonine-protein kinase StkP [Clostridiales bacterium CHKCI006]HIU13580.1 Stk1 family PASTA domain-containing Ser/Thr kinase [Candidatus Fimiplasma intestinipullorum]
MPNGKVLADRYVIKEIIGQGGMADVYLARDTILDRNVAVKILRSHLAQDDTYVQRFRREASAAATLSHRNIIEIYDVGEEDGQYYIVMEYVSGMTLKELIYKRGALHLQEAVDVMLQLTSGVEEAHAHGVIHRDLKPQNILVTDSGILKIGDFGIATVQSFSQVTESQTIMGSLHYLAPEIIRGEKATRQSDIYALGIIFYELLRGQVPFNADTAVNIAIKHMREDIPSIREFNPTIPQSIENIIIRATAKNPEDRYQDVADFHYALSQALKFPDEDKLVLEVPDLSEPTLIYSEPAKAKNNEEPKKISKKEKAERARKQKRKKYQYIAIGVASVLVVIASFFAFNAIFRPNHVIMPDITGMSLADAKLLLADYDLVLDETIVSKETSDIYAAGQIIQSNPVKDEEVTKGTRVSVTVSQGKSIVIDNYVGMRYSDAKTLLENMGIEVKEEYLESEEYSKGTVMRQSLEEGFTFDPESTGKSITLYVSEGYSVTVDSVVGMNINTAAALLRGKGINVKTEVLDPPTSPEEIAKMQVNVVIRQTHENETLTSSNVEVTLYYYDHMVNLPDPDPAPSDDQNDQTDDEDSSSEGSSTQTTG